MFHECLMMFSRSHAPRGNAVETRRVSHRRRGATTFPRWRVGTRRFFRVFSRITFFSWAIGLCFYLLSNQTYATEVKQVQTSLQGEYYVLSADINYQLSDTVKEALENGVPLFWTVHIKLEQQRNILWAKTLMDTAIRYRLQYHALLNMYRVVIVQPNSETVTEQSGDSYNFSTLSAALDSMASLHNLPLVNKSDIRPEKNYFIEIKASFDRDALPLPLQPIAYTNPQWYLSSDWTVWSLKK